MTTPLLVGETVLLVCMIVLVVGLLRSHADILARLDEIAQGAPQATGHQVSVDLPRPAERHSVPEAVPVSGPTLDGGSIAVDFTAGGPNTVLAFLSSGCLVCDRFWTAFREPGLRLPGDSRLIIVTKDAAFESSSKLSERAPADVPVLQASDVWEAYEVPGAPYFIYIDGESGTVHGEGAAEHWSQVESLLGDAIFDAQVARGERPAIQGRETEQDRGVRADDALRAAGIAPDDESFYRLVPPEHPDAQMHGQVER